MRDMDWVEKEQRFSGFVQMIFLSLYGFEKPCERGLVRSVVLFTTILDSGEGNDSPMSVRVNLNIY
jgi:hypothetical protein